MQEEWTCCLGEVKHDDKPGGILVGGRALSQKPDKDLQAEPEVSGSVPYLDKPTVGFGR